MAIPDNSYPGCIPELVPACIEQPQPNFREQVRVILQKKLDHANERNQYWTNQMNEPRGMTHLHTCDDWRNYWDGARDSYREALSVLELWDEGQLAEQGDA